MPAGCGTWPAFWTLSQAGPWPHGGEIDIIEGVNDNTHNQATLHTAPNCALYPPIATRLSISTQGAASSSPNPVHPTATSSTWRVADILSCTKGATPSMSGSIHEVTTVPEVIRDGAQRRKLVYPDFDWDVPAANFPFDSDQCDYEQHFDAHQIVFDLTFCGDWAGSAWSNSGCGTAGKCVDCKTINFIIETPLVQAG
ncbi:concanavalin A-like lectin/glucanase domain-containing protein [Lactarius pseudohatsudake]|nr:concanavalin A-like lectin/glucanase domain-containing protein [Lactarius pseudohatsudake]